MTSPDTIKFLLGLAVTLALSIGASQCSALVQMNRLDEREEQHFREVVSLLATIKADGKADTAAIKMDLEGIRKEVMGILRERR